MKRILMGSLLLGVLGGAADGAAEDVGGQKEKGRVEVLVLGGGCFWCLEAAFEVVPGVKDVVSGYAGGTVESPTYEAVCSGKTGHAEVVRIEFDPAVVPVGRLLGLFWVVHDPTSLNRQGADVGTQYRSVIFYRGEEQRKAALEAVAKEQVKLPRKIVTEVLPLGKFWEAEEEHQDYFRKHPEAGYCRVVVAPKVEKAIRKVRSQNSEL